MQTKFIFFDLGNVLLRFSHDRMAAQAARVAGCRPEQVRDAVFGDGMSERIERGLISEEEFYEKFCEKIGTRPEPERLMEALNDIFSVIEEMQPLLRRLAARSFPRGVLSNVGASHWNFCERRFPFLRELLPDSRVLSFQVGAMKPDGAVYRAALDTAAKAVPGILPGEVLFLDDLAANVDGARRFGLDAVLFESADQAGRELTGRMSSVF